MFLQNDVIAYVALRRTLRILWIDHRLDLAWTFELGVPHGQPCSVSLQALADDVLGRRARLLAHDPYAAPPAPPHLPARQRDQQDKAWRIVCALQAQAPALYRARERAAMVACCALEHGMSRPSVLRYLRRYWERGQTVDALLPDYGNSGARGKVRAATDGVKRGRPRKTGTHPGLNIDAATRAIFRGAVTRQRAIQPAGAAFSRRAAYQRMLRESFAGADAGAVPSFGQFCYWLDKDGTAEPQSAAVAVQHDVAI